MGAETTDVRDDGFGNPDELFEVGLNGIADYFSIQFMIYSIAHLTFFIYRKTSLKTDRKVWRGCPLRTLAKHRKNESPQDDWGRGTSGAKETNETP